MLTAKTGVGQAELWLTPTASPMDHPSSFRTKL